MTQTVVRPLLTITLSQSTTTLSRQNKRWCRNVKRRGNIFTRDYHDAPHNFGL